MEMPDTSKTMPKEYPIMWTARLHITKDMLENSDYVSELIRHEKAKAMQKVIGDTWNARRYVFQFTEKMEVINEWTASKQYGSYPGDWLIHLYVRVWEVAAPPPMGAFPDWPDFYPPLSTWQKIKNYFRRLK